MAKNCLHSKKADPKQLDKKLLAYCAMAGGAFAVAVPAHADVVYSGIKNQHLGSGIGSSVTLNFDIQGPVECTVSFTSSGNMTNGSRLFKINCDSRYAQVLRSDSIFVHNFAQNDVISKALGIWADWGRLAFRSWSSTSFFWNYGNFVNKTGFIGIRFYPGTHMHYGWLRFQTNNAVDNGNVIDWAYESEDNASILAGAMPTTSSTSSSSTTTVEITTTTSSIDTSTTTSIDNATSTTTVQASTTTTTMPASQCTLRVVPGRISPLMRTFQPFAPFIIIGDENAVFSKDPEISWGTQGIETLFKLSLGKRFVFVLARVRPADLDGSETYSVVVDGCSGELTAGR